jgi:hypothetical protein
MKAVSESPNAPPRSKKASFIGGVARNMILNEN